MIARPTVLVVDDEAGTRESLRWILKSRYEVRVAENPDFALRMMAEETMDVVFSDIVMSPFDGIGLLHKIHKSHPDTQVIMMTAFARQDTVLAAMRGGASGYLTKPFDRHQVEDALSKALMKRSQASLSRRAFTQLQKTVDQCNTGSADSLLQALGAKDIYTFSHSKRVAEIFVLFARRYGFGAQDLQRYRSMACLHDIGKIGIRDSVLKKAGPLTDEEFEEMKLHPEMGYHIVRHLDICEDARDIVLHHHERYDGKGYPHGLAGAKIPLASRLFSIVDSFDAMRGTRPYRKGLPRELVLEEIKRHAGTQWDPALAHDFVKMAQEQGERL